MKIGIVVDVTSWQVSEGDPPEVEWGDRGETDGRVASVSAIADSSDGKSYWHASDFELDVERGDTVYPVVVTYRTGDTFGRYGGQTEVMDVFKTAEEALELVDFLKGVDEDVYLQGSRYKFTEEFNGKEYHIPWRGYFEWLQNVDVYPCIVK